MTDSLAELQRLATDRLLADLEYRAIYWRQPGIGEFLPRDAVHDFADELDRAVAALREALGEKQP